MRSDEVLEVTSIAPCGLHCRGLDGMSIKKTKLQQFHVCKVLCHGHDGQQVSLWRQQDREVCDGLFQDGAPLLLGHILLTAPLFLLHPLLRGQQPPAVEQEPK